MTKEQVKLYIDTREKGREEEVFEAAERHSGVKDWQPKHMVVGDILVEEAELVIERKTIEDYASSILERRLSGQIQKMQDSGLTPYILVEDDLSASEGLTHTRLAPESIRGHMASTMARESIPVIPCSNLDLLIDMAVRLGRKYIEEPGTEQISGGSLGKDVPVARQIFGTIPGVGPSMSKELYNEFSTVESLLHADEETLLEMDGIGPKTVETIHESLRE